MTEYWRRGRCPVWHIVELEYHPLGGYHSALSLCERHEFSTDTTTKYEQWIKPEPPKRICKKCAEESTMGDKP